ncbi:MAG: diaminopimelate epimerase [Armatimonadota bacterium]|nr:diaminopimelate epimerase [Armatimonadota bacterium]
MMSLPSILCFTKMHGTGNDFVVLDALAHMLPDDFDCGAAAPVLCARHRGIGGDGLLLLTQPDPAARAAGATVRMQMWNPDGSEDMCGNGLRCIARLAARRGHVPSLHFIVQTLAGLRSAEVLDDGQVRVAMGEPRFALPDIPLRPPDGTPEATRTNAVEYILPVQDRWLPHVTSLSTGSTHTVIFTDEPVDERTFATLSPHIEHHPRFPERTSIMWAHVVGPQRVKLRIWERGVGETLACGTGACAAAVAAHVTGRCGTTVSVESRGGVLQVEWQPGQEIKLAGPARVVFEGKTAMIDESTRTVHSAATQ